MKKVEQHEDEIDTKVVEDWDEEADLLGNVIKGYNSQQLISR